MDIMITYDGYNNTMYNTHKNMGAHYTWQNTDLFLGHPELTLESQRQHGPETGLGICTPGLEAGPTVSKLELWINVHVF